MAIAHLGTSYITAVKDDHICTFAWELDDWSLGIDFPVVGMGDGHLEAGYFFQFFDPDLNPLLQQ